MDRKELKQLILNSLEKYFGRVNDLHKEIFDVLEVADYLNLSISNIRKKTSKGEIPHRKPSGKKLYFIKKEIDEWVANSKRIG
jgi:excisionase family DNA binding protein